TPFLSRCLQDLAAYKPPPRDPALVFPLSRSAAVLVALFVGRSGDIYVMLSRRAETLRTFPGDTSLPGGRYEPGDKNLEDTARREAFEEIGLPRDRHRIPLLCTLEPFPTGNHLLVTPIVVLILDPDIRPILNEPEVSALFSHPLRSFLSRTAPFDRSPLDPSDALKREYYSYRDIPWGQSLVRMHRFLTGREELGVKPVYGLTATICLHVASIGYARPPEFPMYAPSEKRLSERVAHILRNESVFIRAVEQERKDAGGRLRTRSDSQYNSDDGAKGPRSGFRTGSKL
ncbi:hypothetical protein BS47DRAFT_1291844, partial [Hydnum rufescens UP504]